MNCHVYYTLKHPIFNISAWCFYCFHEIFKYCKGIAIFDFPYRCAIICMFQPFGRESGAQRMEKVGQITAVKNGMLEITFCRAEDCGHCHACDGGSEPMKLLVSGDGCVGDYALVQLPRGTVVKASLLAYAVPILGLLGGMALGGAVSDPAAGSAVGGLIGLTLSLGAVWATERFRRRSQRWTPTVTRIYPKAWYENHLKGDQQT